MKVRTFVKGQTGASIKYAASTLVKLEFVVEDQII